MSIAQSLLPEFDQEMANTRKTLERVPENKLDYKPDPKSMSMGVLASHVAEMVGWLPSMMQGPELDIPPDFKPFLATSRKDLIDTFLASGDGKAWDSIESQSVPLNDLRVGIGACSPDAKNSTSAAFDFVRISPLP